MELSPEHSAFKVKLKAILGCLDFSVCEPEFWSKRHSALLGILAILFALLTSLRIHSYSFGMWQTLLGHTKIEGSIEGKARSVRSDDWAVILPLAIAETSSHPKYACNLDTVGHGMSSVLLSHSLCLSGIGWLTSIFKPWTWGFIIGPDFGLSWMWWFQFFALLYFLFVCVYWVSGRKLLFSLCATIGFLYAPYQQFWSLNMADIFSSGFAVLVFAGIFLQAKSGMSVIWSALGLFYWAVAFTLPLYPPTQVMMGYFILCMIALIIGKEWHRIKRSKMHFASLAIVIVAYLATILTIGKEMLPTIETMSKTLYPGMRLSTGGDWTWQRTFSNLVLPAQSIKSWGPVGNICEAAGYLMLSPMFFIVFTKLRKSFRQTRARIFVFSVSVLVLLLAYMIFGVSESFARLTLLSFVPSMRVVAGLGLWDLAIWVTGSLLLHESMKSSDMPWSRGIYFVPWFVILYYSTVYLQGNIDASWAKMAILLVICVLACLLTLKKPLYLSLLFCVWSYSVTSFFNPTLRGGFEVLKEDPLIKDIRKVAAQYPEDGWVVGEGEFIYGNLLRMFGLRTLTGTYYYPQFDLWGKFDPTHANRDVYNRYSHVAFHFQPVEAPKFNLHQADWFGITVDPNYSAFKDEKINLFLVKSDQMFRNNNFKLIAENNGWKIFRRLD